MKDNAWGGWKKKGRREEEANGWDKKANGCSKNPAIC